MRAGRLPLAGTLALVITALASAWAHAAPTFPSLSGRVVDAGNVLSPQVEADLTRKLQGLETDTGRQLVVVTVPSLQGYEIEDYGYQLGRAWGIGEKGKNDGALFIVAPAEKKVRIEVGYGLEPIVTDAMSSLILQERVLPKFRAGDMSGGIVSGADALVEQLALPEEEARERAVQAKPSEAADKERGGVSAGIIFFLLLLFWVMSAMGRRGRRGRGRGRREGVHPALWLLPLLLSGGRGGGGGGSWGGGGGGFGGGGGSFGGGGASGGW